MADLLLLFLVLFIAAYFWQFRRMGELAQRHAKRLCKQQNVQYIASAMDSARPSLTSGTGIGWKAKYLFEFSTDGINQLRGHLWLHGNTIVKVEWPVFPEPGWEEAPHNKGSIGSCSLRR